MTKTIMMSIQPKWVEKILNGEKTIEVRKTALKSETPFKVYIYCTKPKQKHNINHILWYDDALYKSKSNTLGMGVGYFFDNVLDNNIPCDYLNGKVVAEFTCDRIDGLRVLSFHNFFKGKKEIEKDTCLTLDEIHKYLGDKVGYFWHISDLKIYDKPRELGEFHKIGQGGDVVDVGMKRPFQSWGYVEEIGND